MKKNRGNVTISIIGLGLLGSSLAAAFKKRNPGSRVVGISSPKTIKKAVDLAIIDKGFDYGETSEAVAASDLVFLCTPITHVLDTLRQWRAHPPKFRKNCIVTDVGSTKKKICQAASKVFSQYKQVFFIGSHPMTGSEKSGIDARDDLLFENASWILCPLPGTPDLVLNRLKKNMENLGARTVIMLPDVHDKVVANVSHLPQLISTSLAGFIANKRSVVKNALQVAGGGFRDMTRLANSSLAVWEPIFASNKDEILRTLSSYLGYLQKIEKAFKRDQFQSFFQPGKMLREKLSEKNKGFTTELAEVLLSIPDRRGILQEALKLVSDAGLNILDLEVLKVREGESGTVRIGFKKRAEAREASRCLLNHGFKATIR
ncbi:prephenate dehydrogenase/arogenate dehydrogenase family protein [Fibrobacterota bacterium]